MLCIASRRCKHLRNCEKKKKSVKLKQQLRLAKKFFRSNLISSQLVIIIRRWNCFPSEFSLSLFFRLLQIDTGPESNFDPTFVLIKQNEPTMMTRGENSLQINKETFLLLLHFFCFIEKVEIRRWRSLKPCKSRNGFFSVWLCSTWRAWSEARYQFGWKIYGGKFSSWFIYFS